MRLERLDDTQGPRLRTLRLRALASDPQAFGSTYDETASRPPSSWVQQLRDLVTWVAVDNGADVGMVRAHPVPAGPTDAALLSLWVAPEVRGRGVARALCGAVLDWSRAEGFDRVVLEVHDDNVAATALYAALGFERTGLRRNGEHERAVVLRKIERDGRSGGA